MPTTLSGSKKPKLKRIKTEDHLFHCSISEQWLNRKMEMENRKYKYRESIK